MMHLCSASSPPFALSITSHECIIFIHLTGVSASAVLLTVAGGGSGFPGILMMGILVAEAPETQEQARGGRYREFLNVPWRSRYSSLFLTLFDTWGGQDQAFVASRSILQLGVAVFFATA